MTPAPSSPPRPASMILAGMLGYTFGYSLLYFGMLWYARINPIATVLCLCLLERIDIVAKLNFQVLKISHCCLSCSYTSDAICECLDPGKTRYGLIMILKTLPSFPPFIYREYVLSKKYFLYKSVITFR